MAGCKDTALCVVVAPEEENRRGSLWLNFPFLDLNTDMSL